VSINTREIMVMRIPHRDRKYSLISKTVRYNTIPEKTVNTGTTWVSIETHFLSGEEECIADNQKGNKNT
jgi:hypothetical protein